MNQNYQQNIEHFWEIKDNLKEGHDSYSDAKKLVSQVIEGLDIGKIQVMTKLNDSWKVNEWVKKAIMLKFKFSNMEIYDDNCFAWYDKIPPKFQPNQEDELIKSGARLVPGSIIRKGSYIGKNTVVMPSFINIGAYVGTKTLVDTWATIGSCAYVGDNCHISGGVGIGGVLEPLQAKPVVIEDNCFIGARSEVVEGVLVEEGSVISMGVFLGASTKIVNRSTGEITYGRIPPYSVVVPGTLPSPKEGIPGLYCAVIIKQVDDKTRAKTSINELLRS